MTTCSATQLTVPKLDSCLPMSLHSFTWHLKIPEDRTVDLMSPTGSLRQSLPGQDCAQSVSLHVAEGDGFSVGDFCFTGMIQKIQVHANVSVTVSDFSQTKEPFLNVSFSQEIPGKTWICCVLHLFDLLVLSEHFSKSGHLSRCGSPL